VPERAPTPERLAELYDPGGCVGSTPTRPCCRGLAGGRTSSGSGAMPPRPAGTGSSTWPSWPSWLDAGQRLRVVDAAGVTVRVHDEVETPVSGDVVRVGETMTSPVWDGPHTEWANLRFLDVRRTG
jgi:hypothetical protein